MRHDHSEESLVASARNGNSEAFSKLARLHSPQIYRVSLRILKNHADAEDNLQDVLYRVHGHINHFRGRSRLATWIVRITINEALMKIRKQRSECFFADMPSHEGERSPDLEILDDSCNPERQCITKQITAKAFISLPPQLASIFVRNKVEGWTQRELAEETGLSVSAIKSRIFRTRLQMQRRLQFLCRI